MECMSWSECLGLFWDAYCKKAARFVARWTSACTHKNYDGESWRTLFEGPTLSSAPVIVLWVRFLSPLEGKKSVMAFMLERKPQTLKDGRLFS